MHFFDIDNIDPELNAMELHLFSFVYGMVFMFVWFMAGALVALAMWADRDERRIR